MKRRAMHANDCLQSLTSMTKNVMNQIFWILFINSDKKFSRRIQNRDQTDDVEIECRFRKTQRRKFIRYIESETDHLFLISQMIRWDEKMRFIQHVLICMLLLKQIVNR